VAVTFSANHNLKNTQICQVAVKKSWSTENQDKKKPGTVSRGGKSSSIGSQIKLLKKKKPVLVTKVRSRRPHCVERKTRLDFKVKKKSDDKFSLLRGRREGKLLRLSNG
jgi:hypothetical protein